MDQALQLLIEMNQWIWSRFKDDPQKHSARGNRLATAAGDRTFSSHLVEALTEGLRGDLPSELI
jgi:hypothetical protein